MNGPETKDTANKSQSSEVSQRIERAKNELEEMIDLNPQVIVLIDRQGRVVRANKATLSFLGISDFPDILSRDLKSVLGTSDDDSLDKLIENPKGYKRSRIKASFSQGEEKLLEVSVVNAGEAREFSVLIINDASEEDKKAESLERRHKQEALEALTGALMHNINQPLTVIMMRAAMMKISIQQGRANPGEVRRGLDDVMKLAMTVADMLQTVDKPNDFVTEPYIEGVEILDIQKSGSQPVDIDLTCSTLLNVLLTTLDKRIPGTVLHARRCGALTHAIAKKAGLDSRTSDVAREAGHVHDIGKLSIPDSITLKPSSLTEEEYDIMRTHAETGYQIVRSLIFLEDEAEAVRTHHEYWNGTGYPQGLKGEDIPVAARILACADAFEVMLSGRPYRPAISLEDALSEFRKNRCTQFDPVISDVVIEHAEELQKLLLSID